LTLIAYSQSGYWGAENLSSAFLERQMLERCGNMQREREIVTPSVWLPRNARRADIANGTSTRESSGPVACGENEDSSQARGELRSRGRRGRLPSGNLDLWGLEDSDEKFVQLVNRVSRVPSHALRSSLFLNIIDFTRSPSFRSVFKLL
jgi:hypothetical protein